MTRIFDALRKTREGRLAPPVASEAAPPMHPVGGRAAAPAARISIGRVETVPLGPAAPLDAGARREMTALRIHLESALSARVPRTVVLVSAQPGEGTTTVALQFAETMAGEAGLRVLVVDANQARPSPLLAAAQSASVRDRSSRGRVDLFPLADRLRHGEPLPVAAVRDALEVVGSDYDWIVVDSPPLLESPEAAPLASIGDGAVIVVQAGRTKRPVLARANDLLRRAGANVLGTVLNRRRLEIPDFIYRRI